MSLKFINCSFAGPKYQCKAARCSQKCPKNPGCQPGPIHDMAKSQSKRCGVRTASSPPRLYYVDDQDGAIVCFVLYLIAHIISIPVILSSFDQHWDQVSDLENNQFRGPLPTGLCLGPAIPVCVECPVTTQRDLVNRINRLGTELVGVSCQRWP